jgi:hypothetical protein
MQFMTVDTADYDENIGDFREILRRLLWLDGYLPPQWRR